MTVTTPETDRFGALDRSVRQRLPILALAIGLVMALAVFQQLMGQHNTDNAWLFTVGEKLLAGAIPYVDVIETNPPASIMLYLPAVLFAQALHISAEIACIVLTLAGVAGALQLTSRILRKGGLIGAGETGFLWLGGAVTLMLLPGSCFAEREHIAAATALPVLALIAIRMAGAKPTLLQVLIAGLLAGLTVAIKPHFALALVLPFGFALARTRNWRLVLAPEIWIAALLVGAYVATVFLVFPRYLDILPGLVNAYVPVRIDLAELILQPWMLLQAVFLGALAFATLRCRRIDDLAVLTAFASIGFTLAAVIQGKGWINHYLGGVSLSLMALVIFLTPFTAKNGGAARRATDWGKLRLVVLFLVLPTVFGGVLAFRQMPGALHPGLAEAVLRHAPPHPKLISLSGELHVGFPLVRQVGGEWVGSSGNLWLIVTAGIRLKEVEDPAERARLTAFVHQDAATFLADVRSKQPDIILVEDEKYPKLLKLAPELAGALDGYAKAETQDGISVWARKNAT